MTIRAEPCPVNLFNRHFDQPHHHVITARDILHPVVVTRVASDFPIKERQGFGYRELLNIPFVDVARMVVTFEAVYYAAVVWVAYVARTVDGVGQQAIFA